MTKKKCPCCGSTAQVRLEDCQYLPGKDVWKMIYKCGCGACFGSLYKEIETKIFKSSSSTDH